MKKKITAVMAAAVCMLHITLGAWADTGTQEAAPVQESGWTGEGTAAPATIQGIDENGNLSEQEAEDGTVPQANSAAARSTQAQLVNFNIGSGGITNFVQANDKSTSGYLYGPYGADGAYLGMEDGKVKFMISGVCGLVDADQVQIVNFDSAASVSHYIVSNGRLIHKIAGNLNKDTYISSLDNGEAPSYLAEGVKYYGYDGHYFYQDYQRMIADYQSGSRAGAVNPDQPYYNYFQYLPLRSVSNYGAADLSQVINTKANSTSSKMYNIGDYLVSAQNTYGVNALLMASVAANESAWGKSSISQKKNNLFGLNAVDSSPGESANTFASVEQCIREFAETWMSKQYLNKLNWKYVGGFLGNKESGINQKYASDPYWGEKAAAMAYSMDRASGNRDYKGYSIGIKGGYSDTPTEVNVRSGATQQSTAMYQTSKENNVAWLILDDQAQNNFYKVQSDSVLNAERTAINSGSGVYDKSAMYGYISGQYLKLRSQKLDGYWDVPYGCWYYADATAMSDRGIMTGLYGRTFGAMESVARAQFAVVLWRLEGEPAAAYRGNFPDVGNGLWYTDAITWASDAQIVTGYTDNGYFGPSDSINREQMATMMYRYAQSKGYDVSKRAELGTYTDAGRVNGFALEAMQWAVGSGIIQGKDNGTRLAPQESASRAETAIILNRFLTLYGV